MKTIKSFCCLALIVVIAACSSDTSVKKKLCTGYWTEAGPDGAPKPLNTTRKYVFHEDGTCERWIWTGTIENKYPCTWKLTKVVEASPTSPRYKGLEIYAPSQTIEAQLNMDDNYSSFVIWVYDGGSANGTPPKYVHWGDDNKKIE